MEGQDLIELAFALGRMPDEIERSDETWINKMLASMHARIEASKEKKR